MAHFLSDVTHQKLDQRREQVVTTYTKGLRCTDEFTAFVRCVEVVPRRTIQGTNDFVVWTGDQSGTISIRCGILGDEAFKIEKKRNVFVYCLLHYNNHMWAGLSDGYLRIFDVETFDLVFETKLHAAGIRCMTLACGYIFTGGDDWQILQWDPEDMRIVQHGQYSGHQNSVRCFASDGSLLFSGGDDYSIRCWDIDMAQEKLAPWPIIGHRGGIRALVIMEVYLFSGSQDGSVKVWNTQTGQLVKVLDRREGPCTTLMRDESSFRVWSGNVDGSISLWNALTLEPVATMSDHSGSFVCQLHAMCRLNAMKAWSVGANGTVKVWFSETDATGTDYEHITQMESEHHRQVESMRAMLIRNYEDLEHRRQQLTKIEKIDSDRKGKLCEAFANKLLLDVKRSYYAKIMKWRITRRLRHKLQTTAEAQFASSTKDMRTQYYWKLSKFLQLNKDKRRKAELGTALMKSTENGLYGAYLKNLLEFARRSHDAERRRVLGASLATSTQRGLVRIFYTNLQRYADRQRQKKRRDVITQAILRSSDAGVMGVYWKAIGNYIKSQKEAANKNKLGETLFRSTTQGLLRLYYTKLAVRAKKNIDRKKRSDIAEAMMRSSDFGLLSVFYKKLIRYPAVKQATPLENQYADLNKRIKEMEELLASRAFMTEAELEAELKRRAAELEKIQAGNSDLDAEIKALEIENRKLRMDLRRENYLDPTKTLPEQLEQAMYLLKARGVNCLADFTEVTEVHGHSAAEANKLFDGGIVKVQKVFTKVVLPEKLKEDPSTPVWYAPPEAMDKIKRTKKYMDAAVEGIVDIVVAYDMMTFEKRDSWFTEDGFTHEHRKKAEVVNNCNCFLEVVMEHFKKVHEVKVLPKGHPKATPGAKAPAGSPKKAKPKSARKPKAAASPDSPNESPRDTPRDEDAENAASPASPGTADEASPPRITSPPIDDASPGAAASPADSKVKKVRKSKIYLGLVVSDVPAPKGVLLKEVVEGGPAAVAGLKVGDAIVSFGGTAVKTNKASFNAAVTTSAVAGKEVSIGYLRGTSSGSTKLIVGSK